MHIKKLFDESERDLKQAYNYINKKTNKQFFLTYSTKVFYDDSLSLKLYKREEAMEIIPYDLKFTIKNIEGDKFVITVIYVVIPISLKYQRLTTYGVLNTAKKGLTPTYTGKPFTAVLRISEYACPEVLTLHSEHIVITLASL